MSAARRQLLDALVFSNLWMAAAAGALVAADFRALGAAVRFDAVGLAVAGTLVVYNVDRLRDLPRDRRASRERSAFVAAHRRALAGLTGAAAAASLGLALLAGWRAVAMLLPVLGVGLFHRRLKRFQRAKIAYVAASWTCVGVGLPAVLAPDPRGVAWVAAIVAASMLANVIAFNVRAEGAAFKCAKSSRKLHAARACAALGIALAVLAPSPPDVLGAIPLATLAALAAHRPTERFSALFVDGALLLGSLISIAVA